jgi:ketosteroid isomerase-like protein
MPTRLTPMDDEVLAEDALKFARAWLQAFNQQNWEALKAHLHPDIVFTQRNHNSVDKGFADVFTSFYDWRALHTELKGQVISEFGEGNRAALEVHWVGTTRNGETVDFYACLLFRTMEGKLVEITDYY